MALTKDFLCSILSYDKETGMLRWKNRDSQSFPHKTEWRSDSWNSIYAGTRAGCVRLKRGLPYVSISINNTTYESHNIIWMMMTGELPGGEIDHIDRNGANNKWENLRDVSRAENLRNRRSWSSQGERGIRLRSGGYECRLTINKKEHYVGRFSTLNEAILSRDSFFAKVIATQKEQAEE